MALGFKDDSMTGLVSNRSNQVGLTPSEETGSNTGGDFLATLMHTAPQSKPPSFFRFTIFGVWTEEEG